jgi:hypothetical protein
MTLSTLAPPTTNSTTTGSTASGYRLTSTVVSAVVRLAGPVSTGITAQFVGMPEQLLVVRVGNVLLYLTDPAIARRIHTFWDAQQHLVRRLPARASQTWLGPRPGSYPLAVAMQPTQPVPLSARWIRAQPSHHLPAHLQIRIDQLVWQVCDTAAWASVGDAWFDAQRQLHSA